MADRRPRFLAAASLPIACTLAIAACAPQASGAPLPSSAPSPGSTPSQANVAAPCTAAGASFCWVNPTAGGSTLTGAWLARSDDGWAVGDAGTLLRWDGASLTRTAIPAAVAVRAVWGSAADEVWAVGSAILHHDGTAWSVESGAPAGAWNAIAGTSRADVWVVGAAGAVAHFDGRGWTRVSAPIAEDLSSVTAAGPDEAYAASAASGTILRWDGAAWSIATRLASRSVAALLAVTAGDVWAAADPLDVNAAAGARGTALAHLVSGRWQPVVVPGLESARYTALAAAAPDGVWAFGVDGAGTGVAAHATGGTSTAARLPAPALAPRAASATAGLVLAVGDGGEAFVLRDGAWAALDTWVSGYLQAASATPTGEVWFASGRAGGSAAMLRVANGVVSPVPVGVDDVLYGVSTSATDDVWVGTLANGFLHFDGHAWTARVGGYAGLVDGVWSGGPSDVWGIAGASALHLEGSTVRRYALPGSGARRVFGTATDDIWAVGGTGVAYHWDGTSWSSVPLPGGGAALAVWGTAPDDVWMVGANGLALHWDGHALTRVPSGTDATLWAIAGSAAGGVWAAGAGGTVLHLEGGAFQAVASGTTNQLASAAVSRSGEVYLGGEFGTILRTRH